MIKQLVLIAAICGTVQAQSYSLEEYLAAKGKTAIVKDAKPKTPIELAALKQLAIVKLESRRSKLNQMLTDIAAQYAATASRPLKPNEDKGETMKKASQDRKTRSFGILNELKRVEVRIAGLTRAITYYEDQAELDKVGQKLRAEGWIS